MTTHPITTGRHSRQPSLLTAWRWLLNQLDAWLLGGDPGRHESHTRPAFGVDMQFVGDLHDLNAEVMRDGWNRAMLIPTEPIPVIDYHAVVDGVLVPQVTDLTATDIAFLGGVR